MQVAKQREHVLKIKLETAKNSVDVRLDLLTDDFFLSNIAYSFISSSSEKFFFYSSVHVFNTFNVLDLKHLIDFLQDVGATSIQHLYAKPRKEAAEKTSKDGSS